MIDRTLVIPQKYITKLEESGFVEVQSKIQSRARLESLWLEEYAHEIYWSLLGLSVSTYFEGNETMDFQSHLYFCKSCVFFIKIIIIIAFHVFILVFSFHKPFLL